MPIRFGFLVGVYVNCFAFAVRCRSALPSLQVRCKSVPMNGRKMGLTWEIHGRKKVLSCAFYGLLLHSITNSHEHTEERFLFAVSKSIATKTRICQFSEWVTVF